MKTIAIIAQKGGATKTTLAIHLAVEAVNDDKEVMIIDLDPQASATKWKEIREGETPLVVSIHSAMLDKTLKMAREAGAELVIIDTAPHSDNTSLTAAEKADLIIIPTRTGLLDLQTVNSSVNITKLTNKPAVIILSAIPVRGTLADEARQALEVLGIEVSPHSTAYRAAYSNAINAGQTAQEYEPKGKASEEVKELYKWVMSKLQ